MSLIGLRYLPDVRINNPASSLCLYWSTAGRLVSSIINYFRLKLVDGSELSLVTLVEQMRVNPVVLMYTTTLVQGTGATGITGTTGRSPGWAYGMYNSLTSNAGVASAGWIIIGLTPHEKQLSTTITGVNFHAGGPWQNLDTDGFGALLSPFEYRTVFPVEDINTAHTRNSYASSDPVYNWGSSINPVYLDSDPSHLIDMNFDRVPLWMDNSGPIVVTPHPGSNCLMFPSTYPLIGDDDYSDPMASPYDPMYSLQELWRQGHAVNLITAPGNSVFANSGMPRYPLVETSQQYSITFNQPVTTN